ncbi:MAG: transporter substrate-binding domain-containing protein [Desulfobacterales bacterium]|nr:transporter substrate-binding domain-containing protein [Desulfobacterales bacterium]
MLRMLIGYMAAVSRGDRPWRGGRDRLKFRFSWMAPVIGALLFFAGASSADDGLTEAERAFLASRGEIVFVSQSRYPPFEFIDDKGERAGMCIELARWMATELGFTARFVDLPFKEAQLAVLAGEADVLTSLFFSKKRDKLFDFTSLLYDVPATIFVAGDRTDILSLADLSGKRIAMQKGDYAFEFLKSRGLGFDVMFSDDFAEAADTVAAGRADAIIGDEQIVFYHVFKNHLTDKIKKVGEPLYLGQNCMAVRDGEKILLTILNKGIERARRNGILEKITGKWLGTLFSPRTSPLKKYTPHLLIAAVFIVILTLALWLWVARLRRLVYKRTSQLGESEENYRLLVENSPFGIGIKSADMTFEYFNAKFEEIFGYTLEDLPDADSWLKKAYPEEDYREKVIAVWKKDLIASAAGARVEPREFLIRCKDGRYIVVHFKRTPLKDGRQILTCEDVTERANAERALRESEDMYRVTFQGAPDSITITRISDGRFFYVNDGFCELTGFRREEVIGQSVADLNLIVDPSDQEVIFSVLKERSEINGLEFRIRNRAGVILDVLVSARRLRFDKEECLVSITRDVTAVKRAEEEKRELEARLQHAQRMESIGAIASGMAHNFRNILFTIATDSQLIHVIREKDARLQKIADRIDNSVKNGASLVEELMRFSRKRPREALRPMDLSRVVHDTCSFIRQSFDKKIDLSADILGPLPMLGDESQLMQVFMNLFTNARDAMPGGGELRVRTRVENGDVKITVSDTGLGMSEEVRRQCFDPLFTTKPEDEGTGLGLFTTYGIVKNHGGEIEVFSEPGQGAVFKLTFAATDHEPEEAAAGRSEPVYARGAGEKILMVDDEIELCDSVVELLETLEYKVEAAHTGEEAIRLYKSRRPDLVLLDRNMPGMDGRTCARKLFEYDPNAKIIMISGYDSRDAPGVDEGLGGAIQGYLIKPIELGELSALLAGVFDPGETPG